MLHDASAGRFRPGDRRVVVAPELEPGDRDVITGECLVGAPGSFGARTKDVDGLSTPLDAPGTRPSEDDPVPRTLSRTVVEV